MVAPVGCYAKSAGGVGASGRRVEIELVATR